MRSPPTHPNETFIPGLPPTLSHEPELDGDGLASAFESYGPTPVQFASQSNFPLPRFCSAESNSSSSPPATHVHPDQKHCFPWNYVLSGHHGHLAASLVASASETSIYALQNTVEINAAGMSGHLTSPHEEKHKTRTIFPDHTTYPMAHPALTSSQSVPDGSHPEHVVSWYLVCRDAIVLNGPRMFIPQTIYQPHAQGDMERYVLQARLHPPIIFIAEGSTEWGVPIQHLLSSQMVQLVEGNEPAFASCGPSIGIRVQWPGYRPVHKQVGTKDFTRQRRKITKNRLAKVVARCVQQFMDAMSKQAMQIGCDRQWKVGPLGIKVEDIMLVTLHHVSQGSWQPQLRLRRDIGTNVAAVSLMHRRL